MTSKLQLITELTEKVGILQSRLHIQTALSDDITKIRDKNDLIELFSKRLKDFYQFTHTIITLVDHKENTYKPFLLDHLASPIKNHNAYSTLIHTHFKLDEPFIQSVVKAHNPVAFKLEDVMDLPGSPLFLKINHDAGVTDLLMTRLMHDEKLLGFMHIYSKNEFTFTDEFIGLIKDLSAQISSAVINIIRNEEIQRREQETSLLLNFARDLSEIGSNADLSDALTTTLYKISTLKGYVVRIINEDKQTMSTYVRDKSMASEHDTLLKQVEAERFPINDGLQNRVIDSYIPVIFSVQREIQRGIKSAYLHLWEKMGFTTIVGVPLRNNQTNLGLIWLAVDEIDLSLFQGICAQLSIAIANLIANDELKQKEKDQAFLLEFSFSLARIKTKQHLEQAIFNVLQKLLHTKLAMIQVIDDDGFNLTPYMSDHSLFAGKVINDHEHLVAKKINIEEYYTDLVLKSAKPIVFDVQEELLNNKNAFASLWNQVGLKKMHASALRVGDVNIGTLWMLTDHISERVFAGICAQISVAISNIKSGEQLIKYKKQLEHENDYLKEQIRSVNDFHEIIGSGKLMNRVFELISMVAPSSSTVLILGETGTGKELVARAIHNASPRKQKLMIKVNCAALPANLIESELFGHERGAFTGAIDRRIGKFELANNGTLFLDEIGEMPLEAQVKLLRVLQEKELERIGGRETIKINVRVIAATNRNLEKEVKAGRFRSDLYYRLNVFPIMLPSLRERLEDLEALTTFFVAKISKSTGRKITGIAPKIFQQLHNYPWPGNVRELEHALERSVLMSNSSTLKEVYVPVIGSSSNEGGEQNEMGTLESRERAYIIKILKRCSGKISGLGGASEILGIPGNTLHSKILKFKILKADYFSA